MAIPHTFAGLSGSIPLSYLDDDFAACALGGDVAASLLTTATATVLGRTTAATGAIEELAIGGFIRAAVTNNCTAGYTSTSYSAGTQSSGTFTPNAANGNKQHIVNGGAFTLAPPASTTTIELQILNNGSAGTITTSGFTKVTGSFTTTNTNAFLCVLSKSNDYSLLQIQALQ